MTACDPLPLPEQSQLGTRAPTACPASLLPHRGQNRGEGAGYRHPSETRVLGGSQARPRVPPKNWHPTRVIRRRPIPVPGFSGAGGVRKERKRGAQTAPPRPLSASEGKGGGASKRAGPEPELPPERLLNCVSAPLSLRRGGWNPREPPGQSAPRFLPPPANGGARSWGVRQSGLHPPSPPPQLVCVGSALSGLPARPLSLARSCAPGFCEGAVPGFVSRLPRGPAALLPAPDPSSPAADSSERERASERAGVSDDRGAVERGGPSRRSRRCRSSWRTPRS